MIPSTPPRSAEWEAKLEDEEVEIDGLIQFIPKMEIQKS